MLKGIPKILSPELLKVLCEMGHGDRIVIADGNFPSESVGKNALVIRMDGHGTTEILKAVLKLFPLDSYVCDPVRLMGGADGKNEEVPIWSEYEEAVSAVYGDGRNLIRPIERNAFYEQAKTAYAIIATGEMALSANIMLQKGVVTEE